MGLLYLGLLNREPEAAWASYWQGQYATAGDLTQFMAQATSATAEYHNRFMPSDGSTLGVVGVVGVSAPLPEGVV